MILDGKFHGTLDQGKGQLIVYDAPAHDPTYSAGLDVIDNVEKIISSLFLRADHLTK